VNKTGKIRDLRVWKLNTIKIKPAINIGSDTIWYSRGLKE
jgi:hypothetical protein